MKLLPRVQRQRDKEKRVSEEAPPSPNAQRRCRYHPSGPPGLWVSPVAPPRPPHLPHAHPHAGSEGVDPGPATRELSVDSGVRETGAQHCGGGTPASGRQLRLSRWHSQGRGGERFSKTREASTRGTGGLPTRGQNHRPWQGRVAMRSFPSHTAQSQVDRRGAAHSHGGQWGPLLPEPHTHHSPGLAARPDPGQTWYLREGKCHQGPTDHDEVQNIPQVPEVSPRVQQKSQINHLQGSNNISC